jgi:4-hydroxybenzoate polyprenyltransferase
LGFALFLIERKADPIYFYVILLTIILTHIYREYEYVSLKEAKFCFNLPLFILNNIKLMGLFAMGILIAIEKLHAVT